MFPDAVTDMLIALLGICSKEELEELEEEENLEVDSSLIEDEDLSSGEQQSRTFSSRNGCNQANVSTTAEAVAERREVIKNKILAVGKMSRVFAVLREESEAMSELKSVNGTQKLPSDTLANGAEGIKESIATFGDARKSDIENERLPPDLYDASEIEGMEEFSTSPVAGPMSPGSPRSSGLFEASGISPMSGVIDTSTGTSLPDLSSGPSSPGGGPASPPIPETPRRGSIGGTASPPISGTPEAGITRSNSFKRGHSRQSSLGTTMTSPSTRRRSLEGTLQMIRQAMDAKDQVIEDLADGVATTAEDVAPGSPARRGSMSRSNSLSSGSAGH